MTRARLALCALLALLAPAALADGPRVLAVWEDGTGDVTLSRRWSTEVWIATPETDVERVTFSLTEDSLILRYDVVNLSHRSFYGPLGAARGAEPPFTFWFFALLDPASGYRSITASASHYPERMGPLAGPHFFLWVNDADGTCVTCRTDTPGFSGEWDAAGNAVTLRVPRAFLQSDLHQPQAWSHHTLPTSSNSVTGAVVFGDFVPDHGPGPTLRTS